MAIPDARVVAYTNLFKSQMGGGAIAVYQGMLRYQSRKGFGDFFLGVVIWANLLRQIGTLRDE